MIEDAVGDTEVIEAEIVNDDELPAVYHPGPANRPLIDQHTILLPGHDFPTAADRPTYTRADFEISERAKQRVEQAPPENTSATYSSQRRQFRAWCTSNGRVPLPTTTANLIDYVDELIEQGKAPNTIATAITAIRTEHPDGKQPGTKQVRAMLANYRKLWGEKRSERQAPAIRLATLRALVATCDPDHPVGIRDAAMLTLGWSILGRRTEVANLNRRDIEIRDDELHVTIRFSKTDQEAKGTTVYVPAAEDLLVDPVHWVRAWTAILDERGITEGPLFRALTPTGRLQSRARASEERGDRLTGKSVNKMVRRRAVRAQLKNAADVTAHGLRRGGATELAEAGATEDELTDAGRWARGSTVPKRRYIAPAEGSKNSPLRRIKDR